MAFTRSSKIRPVPLLSQRRAACSAAVIGSGKAGGGEQCGPDIDTPTVHFRACATGSASAGLNRALAKPVAPKQHWRPTGQHCILRRAGHSVTGIATGSREGCGPYVNQRLPTPLYLYTSGQSPPLSQSARIDDDRDQRAAPCVGSRRKRLPRRRKLILHTRATELPSPEMLHLCITAHARMSSIW